MTNLPNFEGDQPTYRYDPFHTFEFDWEDVFGEPLVFRDPRTSQAGFLVNPDIVLFHGIEERSPSSGVWIDPRHGTEVLRHTRADRGGVELVEIRSSYLLKYLQVRSRSLLLGHYQDRRVYGPTPDELAAFGSEGEVFCGSPANRRRVQFENRGLETHVLAGEPFLFRRMHFWFTIDPPNGVLEDPWASAPTFDPTTFTLPTRNGPVAPARWKPFQGSDKAEFLGTTCDFMSRVYFRQEVLQKYENATGFRVLDDGSVVCGRHWSLQRSTSRLGNELIDTAIGDFAEGVPFEEWVHWKQHSAPVPSQGEFDRIVSEEGIPFAVNKVVESLELLNLAVRDRASSVDLLDVGDVWRGSKDSLACKQLKWVYPIGADDSEFLVRATLLSTFVVDGIVPKVIRRVLQRNGQNLECSNPTVPSSSPLGSRNLLQRLALVCLMADSIAPAENLVGTFVRKAETAAPTTGSTDIEIELAGYYATVRERMKGLAFLYELRTHGGIAHPPSEEKASAAAVALGLPPENWRRSDYLRLLTMVVESILSLQALIEG